HLASTTEARRRGETQQLVKTCPSDGGLAGVSANPGFDATIGATLSGPRVAGWKPWCKPRGQTNMNRSLWGVVAGVCLVGASVVTPAPARAQMSEVKEKPPMYSYVSLWNIPRGEWGDMAKA